MNRPQPQVLTALTTPFGPDGSVDLQAVRTLAARVRDAGVDGVFAAGTTGEFVALTDQERLDTVRAVLDVFPPDQVVAHVGAASARQAEALTRAATRAGARRLAAITPYFLPAGRKAVLDYYRRVVDAADGAPVYAYLFHGLTNTVVEPELLGEIAAIPGLVGVKVSGESAAVAETMLAHLPDGFEFWSGNDGELGEMHRLGATGVVSGCSNVFPQVFVALAAAVADGDAQQEMELGAVAARVVAGLSYGIPAMKVALDALNLPGGAWRIALDDPDAATRADLHALMGELSP
ncbi:dihydrodipicolinate synthase family protein [Phytoactinopolyspora mesophila]|uniref:Dihydrodipicolinate synthase family protein n=1 Tax=Phytoactinopolyspora mesophila TaxID=2650750 RepID=A0A7K3MCM0_9ACTN|nr:dihydrodipicolinate synthase family protein [Phytoactinopolyspora mesophila]NDL61069.1 dihydrodipicolinate synthase family protein [Phytoactinopolyspora mesophila]